MAESVPNDAQMLDELRKLRARAVELEAARSGELPGMASVHRSANIIECLPDAIFVVDREKRVVAWNRAAEDITGVRKQDILGKGSEAYSKAFYGEVRPILVDLIEQSDPAAEALYDYVERCGTLYAEVYLPRAFSGRGAHVWVTATPLYDDKGGFAGAIETVRDVSAERQAQTQHRRLSRAVDAVVGAVMLTDCEGRIEQINPAFTALTGYHADECIGKTPRILKSGHHSLQFYEQIWMAVETKQAWAGHIINRRKDGSIYHAAETIAATRDDRGTLTGYVAVQRDITEDIERERTLTTALEQAEAATRAKSEFLAKMSHELRTPLNSVIGFTELMIDDAQDPPNEKRARRLEKVQRNAKSLLSIINDILDISKVEAGRFTLMCEPLDFVALLTSCVESVQPLVPADRVELVLRVDDDLRRQPEVLGDAVRLGQVLTNVLSNAAKFTEAGTITVRAGIDDEALRVEVEDTGIGISANDLPTIFDEFQQVDSSSTRRFGGTGLGLAITRKLCRLMGGEVGVRSTPNVGSCFTICLPRVGAPSDTDRGQSAATRGAAVIGAVTPTKPVPQA